MAADNQPPQLKQQADEWFGLMSSFRGYFSKPDVTALAPNCLVAGSKNMVVDYALRIVSRPGYILYNQANTGGGGIVSSYEWETSTGSEFSLRTHDRVLEFDWSGAYNTLMTGITSASMEFAKVLDYSEQQDVLLGVNGTPNMYRWSGGASKVWKSTTTTLTKQGVLGIQLVAISGTPTITAANPAVVSLTGHGLNIGDAVQFSASGVNAQVPAPLQTGVSYYVIASGFDSNDFEVSLTAGGTAINTTGGTSSGTLVAYKVVTANSSGISFVAGTPGSVAPSILDSNNNFVNAGFAAGDIITVVGSLNNSSIFTVSGVAPGVLTLAMLDTLVGEGVGQLITIYNQTGPTWKAARFFSTISGRSILYNGTAYAYTGGENTDTLTGLSSFPIVSVGDAVWQSVDTIPLPSSIRGSFPNFYPNLIGQQLNVITLASTASSMTFGSKNTDYTNFTLTSPRAPGDPYQQPLLDGPATCIVPIDTDAAQLSLNDINTLIIGSGRDSFDQLDFHMSADNSAELLRIIRYKIAKGMGLVSKGAICPIKNDTVYITREPTLQSLSEKGLESPDGSKNTPISDPIKNDFDLYDFTSAHVIYWKRAIWIALPVEGLVLMYDMQRNVWQPPFTIPVSRLAVIGDWLYGHSAVANETYKLWTGTNDNGAPIAQRACFAYNNGGRRDRLKNMATYWTDGYITANGVLNLDVFFGYQGSTGTRSFAIDGTDSTIVTERTASPLGSEPLGLVPLGGANPDSPGGLVEDSALLRFQWPQTLAQTDYFEHFVEYSMDTLDGQFAIVAHGSDQWDSGTAPVSHNK